MIALEEVAIAQSKSGNKAASRATFQVAIDAAKAYPDEVYVAQLYGRVMGAQAACGDAETALATAKNLPVGIIKCGSLLGIASGLLPGREDDGLDLSEAKTAPPLDDGPRE